MKGHFPMHFLYANPHPWVYFPGKSSSVNFYQQQSMKTDAKMKFCPWVESPLGWLTIKDSLLAVGGAWIISSTSKSIIVKISSGGEICGVPVAKKMQLMVKVMKHLRIMRKIVIIMAMKLDSCRGKRCSGEAKWKARDDKSSIKS